MTILAIILWGILFVLAGALYEVGVYKAPWFEKRPKHIRLRYKAVIDVLIVTVLLGIWWLAPTPEFAKKKERETTTAALPSPVAMPMPSTAMSQQQSSST